MTPAPLSPVRRTVSRIAAGLAVAACGVGLLTSCKKPRPAAAPPPRSPQPAARPAPASPPPAATAPAAPRVIASAPIGVAYAAPDTSAFLFDAGAMHLPPERRQAAATLLANYAAAEIPFATPDDARLAARMVGIALRLDPPNRAAVLTGANLARGRRPATTLPAGWSKARFVADLTKIARDSQRFGGEADFAAITYLFDLLLAVEPDNFDALYEVDLRRHAGHKLNWDLVDGRAADAVVSAAASPATQPAVAASRPAPAARPAVARKVAEFREHQTEVTQVAFTPDGRFVLSGGADRIVRMWETTTGREVRRFEGNGKEMDDFALSADGRRLVTLGRGTARVWDVATGRVVNAGLRADRVESFALSSDGSQLFLSAWNNTRVVDPATGKPLPDLGLTEEEAARRAVFSPSGRYLTLQYSTRLVVFDLRRKREVAAVGGVTSSDKTPRVAGFSRDERQLLLAEPDRYYWWDLETRREERATAAGKTAAVAADGRCYVSVAPSGRARVIDSATGAGLADLRGFRSGLKEEMRVAFSPDGNMVAFCTANSVQLWSLPEPAVGNPDSVSDVIVRAAYQERPKPLARRLARIKVVVTTQKDGKYDGAPVDATLTAVPDREGGSTLHAHAGLRGLPAFATGGESFAPALAAVRARYKFWDGDRLEVFISPDTTRGPTAAVEPGAAAALLMLSALEGIELDPAVAVCGNVDAAWRVKKADAAGIRVAQAAAGKVPRLVLPAANGSALEDLLLLAGDQPLWDVEVFGADTLFDVIRVARADRAKNLADAAALFDELRRDRAADPAAGRSPEGQAKLARVLELAPNHLSAAYLMKLARGQTSPRLSERASQVVLYRPYEAVSKLIHPDAHATRPALPASRVEQWRTELAGAKKLIHPDFVPVADGVEEIILAFDRYLTAQAEADAAQRESRNGRSAQSQRAQDLAAKAYALWNEINPKSMQLADRLRKRGVDYSTWDKTSQAGY